MINSVLHRRFKGVFPELLSHLQRFFFTLAHLARCAAAMRLRPAAEILRFGFAVRCFAQRAFCARLILRRAAADIVRVPFEPVANAAIAASTL